MKSYIIAILLCCYAVVSSASQDHVGIVILSFGQNTAFSADVGERALKRKSVVFADDVLKTSSKGRLQIRFTDGSRLSLKPDTEFKITEYQFEPSRPQDGKAIYKLLKGGMRTISGQIGKVDKEDYQLDAVVATIGIRGTDFTVTKLGDEVGGSVNSGEINVTAKAGESRIISQGRSFRLAGANGSIRVFRTPSASGGSVVEESAQSDESDAADEDTENDQNGEESPSGGGESESQFSAESSDSLSLDTSVTASSDGTSGTIPATSPQNEGSQDESILTPTPTPTPTAPTTPPDPTGNGVAAPTGSFVALSFIERSSGGDYKSSSGRVEVDGQSALTIDNSAGTGDLVTGLLYVDQDGSPSDDCSPCTMSGPPNANSVINHSNMSLGGSNVTWGRWESGDFTIIENGVETETSGSFHFMYADSLTPDSVITSKTGDYVYRLTSTEGAYTKPEIETGATGTLSNFVGTGGTGGHLYSGTYFRVDFDTQQLLEIGIEANVAGGSYALREDPSANMSLSNVLNGKDVKISGTCSGGSCSGGTTDLSGKMTIDFVGAGAEGAVTSYGASGTNASTGTTATINGTILLEGTTSP
jgi:hypothetical protein